MKSAEYIVTHEYELLTFWYHLGPLTFKKNFLSNKKFINSNCPLMLTPHFPTPSEGLCISLVHKSSKAVPKQ